MKCAKKYAVLCILTLTVLLCSCGEESTTQPSDNIDAVTTITLVPDTISSEECLDVWVKLINLSTDTLALNVPGTFHVYYSISVNDSGSIWFPDNDSFVFSTLLVAPGDSIVKVVQFCGYRGGNTRWSKIDYDTLASGTYTMNAGIGATNLECCTRGKATFYVR